MPRGTPPTDALAALFASEVLAVIAGEGDRVTDANDAFLRLVGLLPGRARGRRPGVAAADAAGARRRATHAPWSSSSSAAGARPTRRSSCAATVRACPSCSAPRRSRWSRSRGSPSCSTRPSGARRASALEDRAPAGGRAGGARRGGPRGARPRRDPRPHLRRPRAAARRRPRERPGARAGRRTVRAARRVELARGLGRGAHACPRGRRSLAGYVVDTGGPVVVDDLHREERFDAPPLMLAAGIASSLTVPIGPEDEVFGVLSVHSQRQRAFSADDDVVRPGRRERARRGGTPGAGRRGAARGRGAACAWCWPGTGTAAWWWEVGEDRIRWSEGVAALHGLPEDGAPVEYEQLMALIHPDDRAALDGAVRRSLEEGVGYELVFRIVRPDGATALAGDGGARRARPDGRTARLMGIVRDVTARRLARAARAAAGRRLGAARTHGRRAVDARRARRPRGAGLRRSLRDRPRRRRKRRLGSRDDGERPRRPSRRPWWCRCAGATACWAA